MLTGAQMAALALSFKLALLSVLCALPPALLVAWLLARPGLPGRRLLEILAYGPLVAPPVAVGLLLSLPAGPLPGPNAALLAGAVIGFPLLVHPIRRALNRLNPELLEAARLHGAGPFRLFLTFHLPLLGPSVLAGMLLAGARALGELGATLALVDALDGPLPTLPLLLWQGAQIGDGGTLRLALVGVALSLAALAGAGLLARRGARA